MADTVLTTVVGNTPTHYVVHLLNISDGTGESAVSKTTKSALLSTLGIAPVALDIEKVRWNIQGMASVRILWDHTTDDRALVLSGSGFDDFRGDDTDTNFVGGLRDPVSAGGTGDILVTTDGAVSGGSYDITLWLRKRAV